MPANPNALKDAYSQFSNGGYNGSIKDFYSLLQSNPQAFEDSYKKFLEGGYNGTINDYEELIGLKEVITKKEEVKKEEPIVEEVKTEEAKPYDVKWTAPEVKEEIPGQLLMTKEYIEQQEEEIQQKKVESKRKREDDKVVEEASDMNWKSFTNKFTDEKSPYFMPGVEIENAGLGIGNAVNVRIPGEDPIYIDLKSFTDKGKQEAKDKIQKILDWGKSIQGENLSYLQDFSTKEQYSKVNQFTDDQFDYIKDNYSKIGYDIKMNSKGQMWHGEGVKDASYTLYDKDGIELTTGNSRNLQKYFLENRLSKEKVATLIGTPDDLETTDANEATGRYAYNAKIKKAGREAADNQIASKKSKNEFEVDYSIDQFATDVIGNDRDDEAQVIWNYMANNKDKSLEEKNTALQDPEILDGAIRDYFDMFGGYAWQKLSQEDKNVKINNSNDKILKALSLIDVNKRDTNLAKYTKSVERTLQNTAIENEMNKSGISSISRASAYDDQFKLDEQKNNLEQQTKAYQDKHNESIKNIQLEISSISNTAAKDGVTSIEYDDTGGFYTVEARTSSTQQRYQKRLNKIAKDTKSIQEDQKITLEKLNESWNTYNANANDPELSAIISASNKNYNMAYILANDVSDSFEGMLLDVPILFGSEYAKKRKNEIQEGTAAVFETTQRYNEAFGTGNGGRFVFRTLAQQSAPVVTAIAGMGAGSAAFGAVRGANIAASATAGFYGITSAGAKRQELENLEDYAAEAQVSLDKLELNRDKYDLEEYREIKIQLERTIADGKFGEGEFLGAKRHEWNKWSTIVTTGVVEGTVTRYLGTIPNASKMLRNFTNPLDDVIKIASRNGWQNAGNALKTIALRTGGEVLEEELIALGTMGGEALFLGKEADFSQLGDVAVSAIILGGAMSGPGVAYSTLTSHVKTSEMRAKYFNIKDELKRIDNDFGDLNPNDENYDSKRKALQDLRRVQIDRIADITEEMEVGVMLLGADNMGKIVSAGNQMDQMNQQAGVDPTLSEEAQQKQRDVHLSSLPNAEAKAWKKSFELAQGAKERIMDKLDFTNAVERLYGPEGKKIADKLTKKDPSLKKDAKKLAIEVHKEFKEQRDRRAIALARADENILDQTEMIVYGMPFSETGRKNRNRKKENEWLLKAGKEVSLNKVDAVMNNGTEAINAASVLGDKRLASITLREGKDDESMQEEVLGAYDDIIQQELDLVDREGKSKMFMDENDKFLP